MFSRELAGRTHQLERLQQLDRDVIFLERGARSAELVEHLLGRDPRRQQRRSTRERGDTSEIDDRAQQFFRSTVRSQVAQETW